MQLFTYDPIRESQSIPLLRLLKPLRPPEPGTALVLVPYKGEPLTVRHGESISDARYGTYQHSYLVDVAEHRLALHMPLLSQDANFAFNSLVQLNCRVVNPEEIVLRSIRDISAALYPVIQRILRRVSRDFDISQFHRAEDRLNEETRAFTGDSAIRLRNISIELLVDADEALSSGRAYRDVQRETRLMALRRDRHLEMMRTEGVEGLIAEVMEREGPRAAHEMIVAAENAERAELLSVLETTLKHSGADREPWEHLKAERALLDRLIGGSMAPFGGTRSGRLRGPLAMEGIGTGEARTPGVREPADRRAERSAPPDDEPPGGAPHDEVIEARRISRVRGVPLHADEVPDERLDGGAE